MFKSKKSLTTIIATVISVLLLISGTLGLILLQKPLQESQDVRSDASVESGQVLVTASPNSGTFDTGSLTINFQANTQGVQTNGVQLVFNIIGNTLGSTPEVSVVNSSGLSNSYTNIEQTSDGYLVSVIATPQSGSAFSTTTATTIVQLILNNTQSGNIELSFDREKSKSTIYGTSDDSLTHINTFTYTISSSSDSDTSTVGCNETCSSNSDCESNHRCYNGQCRLATNVSSTTCSGLTDQGLDFGCNHYCANSSECDNQYTCVENKCRRPDNPDDEYCRIPSSTIQTKITETCNDACTSHADCEVNMACYSGQCRLATNVSSTTCSAATAKTVSVLYDHDQPTPKGGDLDEQETFATDSTIPAAIISKPRPSPTPTASPTTKDETALDALLATIRNSGLPVGLLPVIALAAGGLILLLIVIPRLVGKKSKPTTMPKTEKATDQYEQKLQTKLKELQTKPAVPPTPTTPPQTPVTPPQVKTETKPETNKSSMMERVKEKGVTPPKI